jgi:flavin reductase (DIM6/NTAB) family NADH-FMN oxidoreductase RutF
MFYEPDNNDHGLPYNPVKACVVPRPIGWITTVDGAGKVNAAPFSFFNVLSYDPPFCLFSAGGHVDDEEEKDSVRNVKETGEFVYNMATWDQRDAMSETGMIIDRAADELAATGLEPLPSNIVKAPRIKGSPVQFECKLQEIVVLPGHTKSHIHHVVFGRVVGVHVDDAAINKDGLLDMDRIRPIARLGYKDYCWVDSSNMFQMEKRSPEELIGKPRQAAE